MSYLSPEALRDLTGLSQGAAQIRWLRENGIRHWVRVDGKPRVPVDRDRNPLRPEANRCDEAPVELGRSGDHAPTEIIVLPLDKMRELPSNVSQVSGIYFLWCDNQLLYIGKSRKVGDRILSHEYAKRYGHLRVRKTKSIPFNAVTCLALSHGWLIPSWIDDSLKSFERAYIDRYQPPYNCPLPNPGT